MMASSSDWIAALAGAPQEDAAEMPGWIAALGESRGFQEGMAFRAPSATSAPQHAVGENTNAEPVTEEIDALEQAFADGEAAGRAAAQAEIEATASRQRDVRLAFRALDQAAMDAFAESLSETVISLCEQVLDASAINKHGLSGRVQEAAKALGAAPEHCALHLNPADIEMLGTAAPQGWVLNPAEDVPRGSLRLESGDGLVHDGPDQWRRAIAEALRG
ncbi:FliH/SctL family protein [Erythrobacter crassostreae]|uniref:Flagellar assembly protein FliH n=1 Tax=Erythrobacter crassostreae TaxID=2828328 RepID=A0A9X1F3P7_9SPHN|nr:FliH/SctL family protein [Erythrobacter crassostrea]MBV7258928.1 hypothetical protein [Erythrobacter crassostrea]